MASASPDVWRRRWRALGLAVDRLLAVCFSTPAPALSELPDLVVRTVVVPGGDGKQRIVDEDVPLVVQSVEFTMGFVASMPVVVTHADAKPHLPTKATTLAVKKINSENVYIGSFDLLLRVHCYRAGPWLPYNGGVVAVDVKITGSSSGLGLSGPSMRMYLEHAQIVIREARKEEGVVATCRVVAFLIIRPKCPTFAGKAHKGSFGFVAYDVQKLLAWNPKGAKMPGHIICQGRLLESGVAESNDGLTPPAAPAPLAVRTARRDRWQELADLAVRPGWVKTQDFCTVFSLGLGNLAHAANRVHKRLRADDLGNWRGGDRGPPRKICRIAALRKEYTDFFA